MTFSGHDDSTINRLLSLDYYYYYLIVLKEMVFMSVIVRQSMVYLIL